MGALILLSSIAKSPDAFAGMTMGAKKTLIPSDSMLQYPA
jgi:hypothetical protein